MNVLMVTGSAPPLKCGVGDYSMQLAGALAARPDVNVTVLTSIGANDTSESGGGPRIIASMRGWGLRNLWTAWKAIRLSAADVVHVQYPTQAYARGMLPGLLPLVARLSGVAAVQTWHEPIAFRDVILRSLAPTDVVVVRHNFLDLLSARARRVLGKHRLNYVPSAPAIPVAALSAEDASRLRERLRHGQQRLVVFVGFVYPHKGVDLLFEIASPETDHVVIAGELIDLRYARSLREIAEARWHGKVTFTGFVAAERAAELLAVADAVVLPFRTGAGDWNSSLLAATANGSYVVTTSKERQGYDAERNVDYSPVDDVASMRRALNLSVARKCTVRRNEPSRWQEIAERHVALYRRALGQRSSLAEAPT